MIIRQTTDASKIKEVLCHPEIYPVISDDNSPKPDEFEPPMDKTYYFAGYKDKTLIGMSCFHWFMDGLKFHPNVLPKYRSKYADEFVSKSLAMFDESIYVEVPKRLVRFSKKHGFQIIGNTQDNKILMELL